EHAWDATIPAERGWRLNEMFEAMERGDMRALYVIGENPVVSEADRNRAEHVLAGLDHIVVQDLSLTQTAQIAHVVLPAASGWCESDGTVTNSERRVQCVRKALDPPEGARDDVEIIGELARRLGASWSYERAEEVWDECRSLSSMHRGMS